uniref:Uncharacterized protein n=1 Tax=Anguilla anguilla TaxID=7936 RepID=A0A0E9SQ76_ANGAN
MAMCVAMCGSVSGTWTVVRVSTSFWMRGGSATHKYRRFRSMREGGRVIWSHFFWKKHHIFH